MDQLVDPVLNLFNPVQSITISCFHFTLKSANVFISQRFYHFDFFPDQYLSLQGPFNSLKTKIQIHVTNYKQTDRESVSQSWCRVLFGPWPCLRRCRKYTSVNVGETSLRKCGLSESTFLNNVLNFRRSTLFWKVPRLRPFVLPVAAKHRQMKISTEHWQNDKICLNHV